MPTPRRIMSLFGKLIEQKPNKFPLKYSKWDFTEKHGVYIICSPKNKVLHVGKTASGKKGLKQRLSNHLAGSSSFSKKYLKPKHIDLRKGYYFKCYEIPDATERALVENLTSGKLCPEHIGTSEKRQD